MDSGSLDSSDFEISSEVNEGSSPLETSETISASNSSHPEIKSALSDYGLDDAEISVYVAGLQLGPRPASIIAKRTGLKRGKTYNVLSSLVNKGIMDEVTRNNVRHYSSCSPESLIYNLELRAQEINYKRQKIKSVIPKLKTIRSPLFRLPRVHFIRGIEGVKEIYEDILRSKSAEVFGIADLKHSWENVDEASRTWMRDWVRRRSEQDVFYHAILVKSEVSDELLRNTQNEKRSIKRLDNAKLPASVYVYDEKVVLVTTREEPIGVVIENASIAKTIVAIHNALWQNLSEYKI